MLVTAITFVLETVFGLFVLAALVRFWMQAFRAPARNPIAQFSMALTDFAVRPLRRVIPGVMKLDWASLVVALLLEFILQLLEFLLLAGVMPAGAALSALLFLAFVRLVRLSIYIFIVVIIAQAVMSWVSPYHPAAPFFSALSDPLLKPVRRVIPPIGGVDISPVFVLIFLQLLLMLPVTWLEQSAAAMLRMSA
ncbi:MAG TPA: YggT family protein [Usitatibacter sp.]|jgi:YggT family protein|nr:YggT family protein [Usitatibacter sp.]